MFACSRIALCSRNQHGNVKFLMLNSFTRILSTSFFASFSVGVLIAGRAGALNLPVIFIREVSFMTKFWRVEEGVVAPGWGPWGCTVRLSTNSINRLFRSTALDKLAKACASQCFFDHESLRFCGNGNGSIPLVDVGLNELMAPHPSLYLYLLWKAGCAFSTMSCSGHWWRWERGTYF